MDHFADSYEDETTRLKAENVKLRAEADMVGRKYTILLGEKFEVEGKLKAAVLHNDGLRKFVLEKVREMHNASGHVGDFMSCAHGACPANVKALVGFVCKPVGWLSKSQEKRIKAQKEVGTIGEDHCNEPNSYYCRLKSVGWCNCGCVKCSAANKQATEKPKDEADMCVRLGCGWTRKMHSVPGAKTCGDFMEKRKDEEKSPIKKLTCGCICHVPPENPSCVCCP